MSKYEVLSLILTGAYDLLTLFLLFFVVYEALIKPKKSNVSLYIRFKPKDTKNWSTRREFADFVLENNGTALKNIIIKSEPDTLGWARLSEELLVKPRETSQYFVNPISYLGNGQRIQFFWCDITANQDIAFKPFTITIEFDNPMPISKIFRKRAVLHFPFNLQFYNGIILPLTERFDSHNIAQELCRTREEIEKMNKNIQKILPKK